LNHFTFPFAILINLFTEGASPRTVIDPGHRDLGRAQTKTARRMVLAERRQPVTVPRIA
jgi:hypothetical protein